MNLYIYKRGLSRGCQVAPGSKETITGIWGLTMLTRNNLVDSYGLTPFSRHSAQKTNQQKNKIYSAPLRFILTSVL